MGKVLALAPFILVLIAVACGGAASPTTSGTATPIGAASPTATPTSTSTTALMPTATAVPTIAPVPTATAVPTTAPVPTATATPTAISDPQPTSTRAIQATPGPLTVNADMQNFRHQDLTFQAGTTVVWTNRDPVQHTVTSGSPSDPDAGSLFDSGSNQADWVVQGETYSFTFNQAGVFPYYCRIHGASMSGTITVTPAQPAAVAPTPTTAPATTLEPTPMVVTIETNIQDFTLQDLTVQKGTTVVWTNRDGSRHTTTAEAGQWDSGALRNGQSFSFTFTEAGVFSYFCSIHRSMTAEVTVNN